MIRHTMLTLSTVVLFIVPSFAYAQRDVSADRRYNAVAWTQNAAEYVQAARQAYLVARMQLDCGLADTTWTADEIQLRNGGFAKKPPAVILDVDETVLDNSDYNARGIVDGTEYELPAWNDWANEKKAGPVPGAKEFISYARDRGVAIYFITNRRDVVKQATIDNLNALGIDADESNVLTRDDASGREGDKVSRRASVASGYRIVLLIGDNFADFCSGVDAPSTESRNLIANAKAELLGNRWIVVPNAMYGQWERVLGDPEEALRLSRDMMPIVEK